MVRRFLIVLGVLFLSLTISTVYASPGDGERGPIVINSDSDFTQENGVTSGSGSSDDPYIIENWTIDASGGIGISISNTTAYFIIRNCTIFNGMHGIYLFNVTNARIENCTIYDNQYGISLSHTSAIQMSNSAIYENTYVGVDLQGVSQTILYNNSLYKNMYGVKIESSYEISLVNNTCFKSWNDGVNLLYSDNVNIYNNTFYDNGRGIYLLNSIDCSITDNTCYSNGFGICLECSNNDNISNNTCHDNRHGIYLYNSNNTVLNDNRLSNCGIFIIGYYNIVEGNTINDRPVLYLEDRSGTTVEDPSIGQVILVNCSDILVRNLNIWSAGFGMILFDSKNCDVSDNVCHENYIGIFIERSYGIRVKNNTCYDNALSSIYVNNSLGNLLLNNTCYDGYPFNFSSYGIYLRNSNDTDACNNTCHNNYYGIYLECSSGNVLRNNTCHNNFHGISLYSSENNLLVDGNACHDNVYGMVLGLSINNTICGNNCFNNAFAGIAIRDCSNNNTICQNICFNNENGVHLLYSEKNSVENNLCHDNYNGISLESSNNNTLCRNTCYGNTYAGVRLFYSDKNVLCENTCYNNHYGIYLERSNNNVIRNNLLYDNVKDLEIIYSSGNVVEVPITPRAPIIISGNDQFTSENGVTSGSGTSDDPYIIADWTINAMGDYGISISNTTAHFIVRNCTIFNGTNGISLFNVTNARIENCTIYNNQYGILFNQSVDNGIENNVCFNTHIGICLLYSENITVNNNTCYNNTNGIRLSNSNNSTLYNNTCYNNTHGIFLENSDYNNLLNNHCYQNNQSGIYINPSNNNEVVGNTCHNNYYGIFLNHSSYSDIADNKCYNNYYGIFLLHSHNNTLVNNECYNNNYGTFLTASSDNSLIYNYLYDNSEKDLEIDEKSLNNTVIAPYILPSPIDLPISVKRADMDNYGNIANNGSHAIVVWHSNSSGNYDIWASLIELSSMNRIATWQLTNDVNVDIYPFVTFIGDRALLTWSSNRSGSSQIYYKIYDNETWSGDSQLTSGSEHLHSPIIQLSNGSLAIAYTSNASGFYDVWFSLLRLNGNTLELIGSKKLTSANETMKLLPSSMLQTEDGRLWIFAFDGYRYRDDFGETTQIYYYCSEDLQNWMGDVLIEGSGFARPSAVLLPNGLILIVFEGDDVESNLRYTGWYVTFDGAHCSHPRLLSRGKSISLPSITYVANMNIIMASYQNWTNATYKMDLFFSYIPLPPVHAPITIVGNDGFTRENGVTSGSGTPGDPYIIENWIIYAWTGNGISISNTTAHFIIRNCTILYGGIKETPYFDGIWLSNVTNGVIANCSLCMDYYGIVVTKSSGLYIINNTFQGNSCDVSVYNSEKIEVIDNDCYGDEAGILIGNSNGISIRDNELRNNRHGISISGSRGVYVGGNSLRNNTCGIYIYNSSGCEVIGNICRESDIELLNSNSTRIENNLCSEGDGIYLSNSNNALICRNTCYNNSYYGISVFNSILIKIQENNCTYNHIGIYLQRSNSSELKDNICHDGYIGIQAYRSKENYIESNDCSNNSIGIVLESSTRTWVRRNTCNECSTGITLSYSDDNNIYHNTCCNGGSGIHLTYSNLNTLSNNTCCGNELGISLQGSRNNRLDSNTCCENRHGIYLTGSRDNEVLYNICRNNNGAGIYMRESTYNYVHHNSCNNNDNGIYLTDSCESNTISGNECLNNSYCGIYIEWSNHNHIHSNKCNENAGSLTPERIEAGITLFRSNNNRIEENECKHNGNHGICLAYSDNNVVSANDCEFNSAAGIYVYNSNGNELSGNICRNNGNGIVIYKSNRNGVHGNRVSNNGNAGINVSNAYSLNEIYENEIYRNRYAIYLYNSRNDTIRNNVIYENNYGVYLHSSSYNIIRNNAFYDNNVNWEEVGECRENQKPPLITSFVPERNALINRSSYYVMANYTDEDGVNATAVRLIFDGMDVTSSSEITADYAKYDFTVGDGLHAVALFLVDNKENSIWYNWTFTIDATPPSITPIHPEPDQVIDRGNVAIAASLSDALSGISLVRIYLDGLNITESATINQTHVTYTPDPALRDGRHEISVLVSDVAGNSMWRNWSFIVDAPLHYAYIYMNQTGGATIIIGTTVAFDIKAYNIHGYGKAGITFTFFIENVPVLTTPPTNASGITSFIHTFDKIPGGTVYAMNDSISTNITSLIVVPPPPPIPDQIALSANATEIEAGDSVMFTITASTSNNPIQGTLIDFYLDGIPIIRLGPTDLSGRITYERRFPTIGLYSFTAKSYEGSITSNTVVINVTAPPPINASAELPANTETDIRLERDIFVSSFRLVANTDTNVSISVEIVNETVPGLVTFSAFNMSVQKEDPTVSLNVTINFKVTQEWIIANRIDKYTVTLYHYNGTAWNSLPTHYLDEDEAFVYYSAIAPSFSIFAPAGNQVADNEPPTLSVFHPANNSIINSLRPTITVNYVDNIGINLTTLVFKLDGMDVTSAVVKSLTSASYTPPIDLAEGLHRVYVSINDTSNNLACICWSFSVDSTPPFIHSLTPANGSSITTLTPTISAKYQDPNGISIPSVMMMINGSDVTPQCSISASEITYTSPPLINGRYYTVFLSVNDTVNNRATIEWTFLVAIPDTAPPSISFLSPANNTVIANDRPIISANYSDEVSGIALIRIYVDGFNVTANATITSTWLSYVPSEALLDGVHRAALFLEDNTGNSIWYNWTFIVDTTPPIISSLSPANGSTITTAMPTISASFYDEIALNLSTLVIKLDGIDMTASATITQQGFTYVPPTSLSQGTHTVYVEIKDTSGNQAAKTWFFTISIPTPPPPTPPTPPPLTPINGSSASMILSIVANVSLTIDVRTQAPSSSLRGIEILTNESFPFARFVTEEYYDNPTNTPLPMGVTSISFIKIELDVPPSAITKVAIRFRVSKFMLSSLGLDPSSVQLYRFDGVWRGLTTSLTAWDDEYYYFEAIAQSLSYFAIAAKPLPVDSTPPTIAWISPEEGALITIKRPTISVKYSDDVAIDLSSIKLLLDDVDVTSLTFVNSSMVLFMPISDIPEGTHSIYFEVKDTSGNRAFKSWHFTIKLPDTKPPIILLTSPPNGSLITNLTVVISALYSDDVEVDLSSIALSIDGNAIMPTKLNGSYLECITTLSPGLHTASLTIKDTSGNAASATWCFTIKLPDVVPPRIFVISPVNGSTLSTKSITINVSYSDDVGIDLSSIILKLDGKDVTAKSIVTSNGITYSTTLDEGLHIVSLTIKDTSGNIAMANWSFTISIPVDYTIYMVAMVLVIIALMGAIFVLKKP